MRTFAQAYEEILGSPAPATMNPQLRKYWKLPVSQLCQLEDPARLSPAEKERHRIYCYLLMAIVHDFWKGYKKGRFGDYPWNDRPGPDDPPALSGDYLGHNIAALAVDANGYVLDFDFNHNTLFNSSAEHAEARLVRRLYSLAQISDSWTPAPDAKEAIGRPATAGGYTSLSHVTVYTSLESCSQCSGVMALAQVKAVVYLQTDPGMYFIGRILRNLTTEHLRAPLPIGGGEIELPYFETLDRSFTEFTSEVATKPFWISADGATRDDKPSVTSFLATGEARAIFSDGGNALQRLIDGEDTLSHRSHRPPQATLDNKGVVGEAKEFLSYAITNGRRGTPHNL